jgi:hypothetical protein
MIPHVLRNLRDAGRSRPPRVPVKICKIVADSGTWVVSHAPVNSRTPPPDLVLEPYSLMNDNPRAGDWTVIARLEDLEAGGA